LFKKCEKHDQHIFNSSLVTFLYSFVYFGAQGSIRQRIVTNGIDA